jgi:hypothetical protein
MDERAEDSRGQVTGQGLDVTEGVFDALPKYPEESMFPRRWSRPACRNIAVKTVTRSGCAGVNP